jgi:hypothetical protein
MAEEVKCPISGEPMDHAFTATVLGIHAVKFFYCGHCGLLKSEAPYWLEEAYREAISATDTGLVGRNIGNAASLEIILETLFSGKGNFLDVAGGYGLLARLLRDKGFDCYTTDKYCENIFAQSFEPGAGFKADALFAFEVFEHIEDPLRFLQEAFQLYECRTMIFSTETFSGGIPSKDWWYYGFESGQHITFYQQRTLALMAKSVGCRYYKINSSLRMITDLDMSKWQRLLLFKKILSRPYAAYIRHRRRGLSRTWDDHIRTKARLDGNSPIGVSGAALPSAGTQDDETAKSS